MEQSEQRELKHSGLGIASFIISIVAALFIFILVVVAGVVETATPGGMDEDSAQAIIIGLFIIGTIFVDLVALGLGIAGLFIKERKKVFAILGTIFSAVTMLGTVALMIIGSML